METYTPKPPLSDFVASFWSRKGPAEPERELALPTGTIELVINLRDVPMRVFGQKTADTDGGFKGGVICGPHTESFVIDSAADEEVIGVNFKPGGLFPFVEFPGDELQNALVPMDAVWNTRAASLRDELVNASTTHDRFHRLERILLRHVTRPLVLDRRVAYSIKSFKSGSSQPSVAQLADDVGLSHRRYIELFRTITGLTPKQYARVQRLQRVLTLIDSGQPLSWADIAYACDYYDQSHFYRDFQAMTSMLPSEYAKRRGERTNHVSLMDA